jgi:hypothetical protein
MGGHTRDAGHPIPSGRAGPAFWALVAACVPLVVAFALIALRVI